jgi:hypothetical protein
MENQITVVESNDTAIYLITKAEVDMQISTAKAFPRSIAKSVEDALSMATMTEDIAQSCTYSMPRAGKNLEGPSVRLAEIMTSAWGNSRSGARVIDNDGKTVTAQGIFHDLEKNVCITIEVKKRITDRNGKAFSEDMQVVTGNAACAIAFRNAVFKGIPASLVASIYDQVKQVAKGTAATLKDRRAKAVSWFNDQGVKDAQLCESLGIKKVEDIDLDKLSILNGMRSALKNGETTIKEMFETETKKAEVKKPEFTELHFEQAFAEGVDTETIRSNWIASEEVLSAYTAYSEAKNNG